MKVQIKTPYLDLVLDKYIAFDEVLDMDEDRIATLANRGVVITHIKEEKNYEELVSLFKDDKNIVDGMKADELKVLCSAFEIEYTNAKEAKEFLKAVEVE